MESGLAADEKHDGFCKGRKGMNNPFSKRFLMLPSAVLLCAAVAIAQAPASVVTLDGTVGPTYTSTPPPNPPTTDYWNRINGTGALGSVFDGTNFSLPYTATKPYSNFSVNTFVSGAASTDSFQGGGSKDPNQISQWAWSGSPTPDKDTLTNGYAAAYTGAAAGNHTVIVFGADRFSTSGDANIGIWFFQQNVGPVTGGKFSGLHQNGDIFLISAFTGGGGTAGVSVFLWNQAGQPGAVNGGCPNSNYPNPTTLPACAATNLYEVYSAAASSVCGSNPTCAITNNSPQTAEWQYIAKSNQNAGTNIIPQGAFFTGGVDLTFIFGLVNTNVPCLSSFLFDTRSSQSPTAVLKDFLGGSFPLCAIGSSASCAGTPSYTVSPPLITYTINGNVINQASGTLYTPNVTVDAGSLPSGTVVTNVTQPVGPIGGGASVPFSITLTYPNQGNFTVTGEVCAAAFPGGPCNVASQSNGNAATWSAALGGSIPGGGTCSITTNTSMSLTKSCVVNLSQTASGVVLQLYDTIKVCNTDAKDTITNISLTNAVDHGPAADIIATGLTLAAGQCQTYNPTYTPTACVGGVVSGTSGRCLFSDTVSLSAVPKDEFGNPLTSPAPSPQVAQCAVCPAGACIQP
jgi:hypothetical protein